MQMSQNNLFLTPDSGDKSAYIRMMESTVHAIAEAVDHGQAYAGMGPYELRAAVHSEELLPAQGQRSWRSPSATQNYPVGSNGSSP